MEIFSWVTKNKMFVEYLASFFNTKTGLHPTVAQQSANKFGMDAGRYPGTSVHYRQFANFLFLNML